MTGWTEQIAIVTGGSRGIGRAIARALAARGAAICINYATRAVEAEAAAGEIAATGGRVIAFQADVADADAVARMVTRTDAELGPVSILVNNAGVSSPATLESYDPAAMARMRRVNVDGVIHTIRAVARGMQERGYGRIVNIASNAAIGTATRHDVLCSNQGGSADPDSPLCDGTWPARDHGQRSGARLDRDRNGECRTQRRGFPSARSEYERADNGRTHGAAGRYRQRRGVPCVTGIWVCDSPGPHH